MPKSESFNRWYQNHKHEHNARRRARYAADSKFAKQERKRLREWRQAHPRSKPTGKKLVQYNGSEIEVFSITKVARLFAVRTAFIRGLESKGLLPEPTVDLPTRHYTRTQVVAMAPLVAHWRDSKGRYRAIEVIDDALDLAKYAKGEWLNGDVDEI